MAERWNEWITKEQIKKSFIGNDMILTNGIKALRDRNIILSKRGVRGHYRLQWLSFAFWIKIHKQKISINGKNILFLCKHYLVPTHVRYFDL